MPKAATQSSTKAAVKTASAKPKAEKEKRPPSAYNVFMKDKLTAYKANHPELSHKDAFKAVAGLWKDAPENPNRGQDGRSKTKKSTEDKENAAAAAKSRAKPKAGKKQAAKEVEESDEEDDGQVGSED